MKIHEIRELVHEMGLSEEIKESVFKLILHGYNNGLADGYSIGRKDERQGKDVHSPILDYFPQYSLVERMEKAKKEEPKTYPNIGGVVAGTCQDCGGTLYHEEGCTFCRACGFSKC